MKWAAAKHYARSAASGVAVQPPVCPIVRLWQSNMICPGGKPSSLSDHVLRTGESGSLNRVRQLCGNKNSIATSTGPGIGQSPDSHRRTVRPPFFPMRKRSASCVWVRPSCLRADLRSAGVMTLWWLPRFHSHISAKHHPILHFQATNLAYSCANRLHLNRICHM